MKRLVTVFVLLLLCGLLTWAGAKSGQYCDISFTVIKEDTGKPAHNASVVLHRVNDKGKQERGGLQLKTNSEGQTSYSGIPYGKLRVQVIMRGFQTYGEDFDINQPQQEIVIKLKRPQEQHSIYK